MKNKKVNGKQKGASFELSIAKVFSEWYGCENSFARSPGSGAWSNIHDSNKVPGDIVTPEKFPFVIECKKQEVFELYGIFKEDARPLLDWWEQACRDATRTEKLPLLIIGRNRQPTLICMYERDFVYFLTKKPNILAFFQLKNQPLVMLLLEDFLLGTNSLPNIIKEKEQR